MKLIIKIDLDNAAFYDEIGHLDYESIADHIKIVTNHIRNGRCNFGIQDINGNSCGFCRLEKDEDNE